MRKRKLTQTKMKSEIEKAKRAKMEAEYEAERTRVEFRRNQVRMIIAAIEGSKIPDLTFLCAAQLLPVGGIVSFAISMRDLKLLAETAK